MKTVYLVRHGKAVSRNTDIPDYDRTLAERGVEDSTNMAAVLKNAKVKPDHLISSPAPRALKTATILGKRFGIRKKDIVREESLYSQADDAILQILRSLEDSHETVILVGHNPSFTEFARFLACDFDGEIPTSGVVGITCQIESWNDIIRGCGEVVFFEHPAALKSEREPVLKRGEIEKRFRDALEDVLVGIDSGVAKIMKKEVDGYASDLAKKIRKRMKKKTSGKKKK